MDDNEQVGGNKVAIEETREGPVKNNIIVEGFGEEWQYPTRERQPLEEWWRKHILPQHGKEHANVAIFEASLSWREATRYTMWKPMGNIITSLYRIDKLRNSIA